jgi:hypothetical protein
MGGKVTVYRNISENLKQTLGPETHPDIRFLKNVTGAFVVPGISRPRDSIALFDFWHDGIAEGVALGLVVYP